MAYSEAVLQRAQARLAQARQQHDEETRSRIEAIYAQQPRLRQIDQTLRQTAARIMAVSFRRGEDPAAAMAELKKENLALQQERDWLLESNDIDPDDLSPAPLCPRCGGTGYVGAVMCDCLRELCRQEQKKELPSFLAPGRKASSISVSTSTPPNTIRSSAPRPGSSCSMSTITRCTTRAPLPWSPAPF